MDVQDYLFIVNPISGGLSKTSFYDLIREEGRNERFSYQIYETTGKNDEENIAKLLSAMPCRNLVAVGGDGTLLLAARLAMNTEMNLGVVPFGSANGMARELHVHDRIFNLIARDRLKAAWAIIRRGQVRFIDMIRINQTAYCLHIGDIGLNAKIVKRFKAGKMRGFRGYARQFLKELPLRRRISYHLEADGHRFRGKAFMIAIANATMYGTGAVINPLGALDDGRFEICLIKNISLRSLFKAFLSVFRKKVQYQKKDIRIVSARRATLWMKEKHTLQTDGEVVGEVDQIRIEMVPKCLRILA
jgi:diacylglycerol kinase (ATP)